MDVVDTPKQETQDMSVMELTEKISETIKKTTPNLWGTNRERTTSLLMSVLKKMKDIQLKANSGKLNDTIDNIGVAFRAMEVLTEINDTKVANKSVKDIVKEMLDTDSDEELTSVSDSD